MAAGRRGGRGGEGAAAARTAERSLTKVAAGLAGGGEDRPGQREMAGAVATAIANRRHLIVQAGTGTGKSLAYLVAAILSGQRVVVATATKALQDQLAERDLPLLNRALGQRFTAAVLKGRSNYLCRQRAAETTEALDGGGQTSFQEMGGEPGPDAASPLGREVARLVAWARRSATGDRAELDFEPSPRAWALVSVGGAECPGRSLCPSGWDCFAEAARDRAAEADVVVVNTHLYGAHLANDQAVLPPHDVVVFDEAHELEDIATASLGTEIGAGRLVRLARAARPLVGGDKAPAGDLEAAGERLEEALSQLVGQRLRQIDGEVAAALALVSERLTRLTAVLRQPGSGQPGSGQPGSGQTSLGLGPDDTAVALADPARARAILGAGALAEDLARAATLDQDQVAWVERSTAPVLRLAPVEVGPVLADRLWGEVTAILTSATVPPGMGARLGVPAWGRDDLRVDSPFPYDTHALLYCAAHLPDRRAPGAEAAAHQELASLIRAAGGRTLALFTSHRGMQEGARVAREQVPFRVLTQDELPKPALVAAFAAEESSCLFATMGFWHGIDVPGPTLSLVVIDRLPFPRPDDPLMSARRERVGPTAFQDVDLPRAAMLLAQGAGRLIRSSSDRGVVAVLDRRLARASYRWPLINALPPMRRTKDRSQVDAFLAALGPVRA